VDGKFYVLAAPEAVKVDPDPQEALREAALAKLTPKSEQH
jgi:hypothetical protein